MVQTILLLRRYSRNHTPFHGSCLTNQNKTLITNFLVPLLILSPATITKSLLVSTTIKARIIDPVIVANFLLSAYIYLMKHIICCILYLALGLCSFCQPISDSFINTYNTAKTQEQKGRAIQSYLKRASMADSSNITKAMALRAFFTNNADAAGVDYTELFLAHVLVYKGDFTGALNMAFPLLSHFEERKDDYGIMVTNHMIGNTYDFANDLDRAILYLQKTIPIAKKLNAKVNLADIYNDIAVAYALASKPDSGMHYAQMAVNLNTELKDTTRLGVSLSTLAENYLASGDHEIAIPVLRKAFNLLSITRNLNNYHSVYLYNDFAQAFLSAAQYDSVKHYAICAVQLSTTLGYRQQTLRAYEYLYKSFEETKQADSVNKYFRLAMTEKDSLFSLEKTRTLETLGFRDKLREQELQIEKSRAEQKRKANIQYVLIALSIILFIIIYLLLSRSFITNTRLIEFFGIVALLIVFEFLTLLLHPFLAKTFNHSPILILCASVLIAALLVPIHHKLEKWAIAKLVEKNKQIRLAAAKKTIEKLEGRQPSF